MNDFNLSDFLKLHKDASFNLDLERDYNNVYSVLEKQKRLLERIKAPDYEGVKSFCNEAFNEIEDKLLLLAKNGNIGLDDRPILSIYLIYVRMYFEYENLFKDSNNLLFQNKPKNGNIKPPIEIKDFFAKGVLPKTRNDIQKVLKDHYERGSMDKIADYLKENKDKFQFKTQSKTYSMTNFFKILLEADYKKSKVDNIQRKYKDLESD